jgi:hypothetical protein
MDSEVNQALFDDVEKIKQEIQTLKSFQDIHLKELRNIAAFIIMSTHNSVIDQIPPDSKYMTVAQLNANTDMAIKIVETSANPLAVAIQFYNNCYDALGKPEIKTITFH